MSAPTIVHPDPEAAAILLRANPDYRVLRRFRPRDSYSPPLRFDPPPELKVGLYVDVETTGLDTATDRIIELALVPFEFDHCGNVYAVLAGFSFFNDPGVPIPPEVTALTGITDEQVRGQSIDEALVQLVLDDAAVVIAHNAAFDRKMLERRIPAFAGKPWACSYREVEWGRFGCVGGKLEHILEGACGEFYEAHRALDDCRVGVHVLATAHREGRSALSYLLDSARESTVRVWAVGAAYQTKDRLKARQYRWADGSTGGYKAWYRDVRESELEAECAWLRPYIGSQGPLIERFDALDRYSVRAG